MISIKQVQTAMVERLKGDAVLVALLGVDTKIKEVEWQGADFKYPAVRVENTVRPNLPYCSPDDVDITIHCLSEEKSSLQCQNIVEEICNYLHGKPFEGTNGLKFVFIRVTEAPYPKQQEGQSIWLSSISLTAQAK